MQDVIGNVLKEKLSGVKITIDGEEKELLPLVYDWEEYLGKLKTANADLVSQREKWEAEKKQFKSSIAELERIKSEIESKLNDREKSTGRKSQEFEELQKQYNTTTEELGKLKQLFTEEQKRAEDLRKQSQDAYRNGVLGDLRTKIMAELGKHKIVGTQADAALAVIETKGLAKIIEGEGGKFMPTYTTIKDGKSFSATLESMAKQFAEDNPFFVSPSGTKGPGMDHGGAPNPNQGSFTFNGKESTQELRNAFRRNL